MARRATMRVAAENDPEPCGNSCAAAIRQADATEALAKSMNRLAGAIEDAGVPLNQIGSAVDGLHDAQQKLCMFLVKHRLKLVSSVPLVLVAVGAISPNAGEALRHALKAFGLL